MPMDRARFYRRRKSYERIPLERHSKNIVRKTRSEKDTKAVIRQTLHNPFNKATTDLRPTLIRMFQMLRGAAAIEALCKPEDVSVG